jgi:predicted dinucleotide-binding enzyme
MSSITIIGAGNMARGIGSRAVMGGNTVQIISRDQAKAASLAKSLGADVTTGAWGSAPTGDIVFLAVLFASAVPVAKEFGDALAGKIVIDITNPFNATGTGLAVPDDTSVAKLVDEATPASTRVIKGFNTLFSQILASGEPADVFFAGDDAQAKADVATLITSLGLRPRDAGDLSMAHWLEGAGLLEMGLARGGLGLGFSLGVNIAVGN